MACQPLSNTNELAAGRDHVESGETLTSITNGSGLKEKAKSGKLLMDRIREALRTGGTIVRITQS